MPETAARPRHTFSQQKEAAERELRMRRSVYPRWIANKKMTQAKADREIVLMEDIVETLSRLVNSPNSARATAKPWDQPRQAVEVMRTVNDRQELAFDPSPWHPETDPKRLKVLGKLAEEASELAAILARCIIQGIDEREPVTGKLNREQLEDEIADVLANIHASTANLRLDKERMSERVERKASYIQRWLDGLTRPESAR